MNHATTEMPYGQLARVEYLRIARLAKVSFLATHSPRSATHRKVFPMTPAQEEALQQCAKILGEHFEAHVLITMNIQGEGEREGEARRLTYGGGFHTALGLVLKAKHEMLHDEPEIE